jgi:beta-lactamase class D
MRNSGQLPAGIIVHVDVRRVSSPRAGVVDFGWFVGWVRREAP